MPISFARLLRRTAPAAAALALLAPSASAAPVTSASLTWSTEKIYDLGAPGNVDHTWLGYVTSPFPLANGTATPSLGATGPTVTNASAAGEEYAFAFPGTQGTYEPATGEGSLQLDGTLTFFSPPPGGPPNGGHGFTLAIADPRLVLDGDHGQLLASGTTPNGPAAFTDTAVFDLDLSEATVTLHADGSRTIAGIVPSVATTDAVFPAPYVAGSGPDRTPNTFGSFALRVRVAPAPAGGGTPGPAGPAGPEGKPGKTVVLLTSLLRRAPFPDGKRHRISVLGAKDRKVLATGAVRARTLSVRLVDDAPRKRLHGVVLLRIGTQPAIRVRVL